MKYRNPISWLITKFFSCLMCAQSLVAAPFGYVTNATDNTVSIIDTATNTTISTVTVGFWPMGVAVTPDGLKVYVCNSDDDTVSVIDAISNTVIGDPIPVGRRPNSIAITPDGSKAYVCNGDINTVSVIDTSTDRIIGQGLPVGAYPRDIAITPDGTKAYVCNADEGTVSVIDIATNTVVGIPIQVGSWPMDIAISPDGSKAYVCNNSDSYVSVIKLINSSVTTIPIEQSPVCVAFTPNGAKAYVTTSFSDAAIAKHGKSASSEPFNAHEGTVVVINAVTDQVIGNPIPVGDSAYGIAITSDGNTAYVCIPYDEKVSLIDTATDEVVGQGISVGHTPSYIAIGPALERPSAPSKFIGKIERHSDSFWQKTTLFMKWEQSSSANIDHYEIFGSGKLIASIPASAPLKFHKRLQPYTHDKRLSKKYLHFLHEKYRIRAVSIFGIASPFKKLKIVSPNANKDDLNAFGDQPHHDCDFINMSSL